MLFKFILAMILLQNTWNLKRFIKIWLCKQNKKLSVLPKPHSFRWIRILKLWRGRGRRKENKVSKHGMIKRAESYLPTGRYWMPPNCCVYCYTTGGKSLGRNILKDFSQALSLAIRKGRREVFLWIVWLFWLLKSFAKNSKKVWTVRNF